MGAPELDAFLGEDVAEQDAAQAVRAYQAAWRAHLLAELHAGARGEALGRAGSDAVDRLILRLYQRALASYAPPAGARPPARFALVAVGGYGRREMSIGSDIDLLFLAENVKDARTAHLAERMQYVLWDAGVKVGAALRDVKECIRLARSDETAKTTILVTRLLAGDTLLFDEFEKAVRSRLLPDPAAYLQARVQAVRERHERFGESLYLLEPNLKEGAGGLRDYHGALWAACAVAPGVRSQADFARLGLLSTSELREFEAALDVLWRLRSALHGLCESRNDQLTFELQVQLAEELGISARGSELPVEILMRDYYRSARTVQALSEIVTEQCLVRVQRAPAPARVSPVEDGFVVTNGALEIPGPELLRERPLRLLSAFAVAQYYGVPLSRDARRMIREALDLVDEAFCRSAEARDMLLRILGSDERVARSLSAMNETGLLARYIPEWENIVCRWQHVAYHTYTVDVHSIFLVEQLRRLWRGEYEEQLPDLAELVRSIPDRQVLFLGCLLHDIGKGYDSADHSKTGAELAQKILKRLGLSEERSQRVVFIVEAHLLMSHIAQRRDLSDPKVIADFAFRVGDRENLVNLYLATFADMRASSDAGFTSWRRELLRELYERSSEYLEAGEGGTEQAARQIHARSARRRETARGELLESGTPEAQVDAFLDAMPERYFGAHTPRQVVRHAAVVLSLKPGRNFVQAARDMRSGYSELIVCSRDQHGLYGKIAGCVTAAGINIIASQVYTTKDGIALEAYRVTTPPGLAHEHEEYWQRFERTLNGVLEGEIDLGKRLRDMRRPLFARRVIASGKPAAVSIRNDVSDSYTVVDITADDRLGLLYDLTRTMAEHDLEIYISKATTVLDQAGDTFYVKTRAGLRLTDLEAQSALSRALVQAAAGQGNG